MLRIKLGLACPYLVPWLIRYVNTYLITKPKRGVHHLIHTYSIVANLGRGLHQNVVEQDHDYGLKKIENLIK